MDATVCAHPKRRLGPRERIVVTFEHYIKTGGYAALDKAQCKRLAVAAQFTAREVELERAETDGGGGRVGGGRQGTTGRGTGCAAQG